jgi:hypothetical protein
MTLTICLFDVDGVLIYPRGYKEALRATVDHIARLMGLPDMAPTYEDIAVFEASGLTNEWDSAPMCVGALLADALERFPALGRPTLEGTLEAIRAAQISPARPDYQALARRVLAATPDGEQPTHTVLALLQESLDPTYHSLLAAFLPRIWTLDSYTTRVFQHHTLGSVHYAESTGFPAEFETSSTLLDHDQPVLSAESREQLRKAYEDGRVRYTIYTARPSGPPRDLPTDAPIPDTMLYPPEGDLAAEQVGLADAPLIAGGRVGWLAAVHGKTPTHYIKPSPVQALAAIGAAISGEETASLEAAVRLAEDGVLGAPFDQLDGQAARVVVFEDSVGGILATRRAVDLLAAHGLSVTMEAVGVATEAAKREALGPHVARLAADVNEALAGYV